MKRMASAEQERRFVPVVIRRLAETYQKLAANPHPLKTLIWYEILKDGFPQWGEEIMGIDFLRTAWFAGDVEEDEEDVSACNANRKVKRTGASARIGQGRKPRSTRNGDATQHRRRGTAD